MNRIPLRLYFYISSAAILGILPACGGVPLAPTPVVESYPRIAIEAPSSSAAVVQASTVPVPSAAPTTDQPLTQARSRWTPVAWTELPGIDADSFADAWGAWVRSCDRPDTAMAPLCPDVRRLSGGSEDERRSWMYSRLQPYRVESLDKQPVGLLTGYYEPVIDASRRPDAQHTVALYGPPPSLYRKKPWYSRKEMDTLPEAQAELRGRELVWLADPVAALNIQIQGSGRVRVTEPDGSVRFVRLSYAGTNDQLYSSVGRWLVQQGLSRDGSWPSIRSWVAQNPGRVQEMLWSNPRVTFFKEEALPPGDATAGPRGAQGVSLTAGRSIAVDPGSIPYGTPVWLASSGQQVQLQRLVLAQDTGSAVRGAVRADYFVGTGPEASAVAGRLRQPLRLWVLWPRDAR